MPRLFALSGDDAGEAYAAADGAVIGRNAACEVRLSDRSISRRHARLVRDGRRWVLEDLGSRNGLVRDGERIERAVLVDGDEVQLGEVALRFREPAATVPAPSAGRAAAKPAAPPPKRSASPRARPSGGGIELEEEIDLTALAPKPAASTAARPSAARTDERSARRAELVRATSPRGSLLTDALEQRPAWVSALLVVVVLALAGALGYGAFLLVVGARG